MNTLKTSLFSLLFFFTLGTIQAQFAIKAGVNFANMNFESEDDDLEDLTKNGAVKLVFGVAFIVPIADGLALQPELLYTQKGADTEYNFLGSQFKQELTYDYLDIPILLRLSLGDTEGEGLGIYFNGGPYLGYAFSGRYKIETPFGNGENDFTFDDEDDQGRIDFGLAVGAGVTVGKLMFDLRYSHGINNLLDSDADNSNDGSFDKLQHRGLALTAGLIF